VHDRPVTADTVEGKGPPATQDELGVGADRAVTRPESTAEAVHRPPIRQSTEVTSEMPAGMVCGVQVVPASWVESTEPVPPPTPLDCPTATQIRGDGQAMSDRNSTVAGTVSTFHERPPSVVATTAAVAGALSVAVVEPTAQHRADVGQATALSDCTGAGRESEANEPVHGASGADVGGELEAGLSPEFDVAHADVDMKDTRAMIEMRRGRFTGASTSALGRQTSTSLSGRNHRMECPGRG